MCMYVCMYVCMYIYIYIYIYIPVRPSSPGAAHRARRTTPTSTSYRPKSQRMTRTQLTTQHFALTPRENKFRCFLQSIVTHQGLRDSPWWTAGPC